MQDFSLFLPSKFTTPMPEFLKYKLHRMGSGENSATRGCSVGDLLFSLVPHHQENFTVFL